MRPFLGPTANAVEAPGLEYNVSSAFMRLHLLWSRIYWAFLPSRATSTLWTFIRSFCYWGSAPITHTGTTLARPALSDFICRIRMNISGTLTTFIREQFIITFGTYGGIAICFPCLVKPEAGCELLTSQFRIL